MNIMTAIGSLFAVPFFTAVAALLLALGILPL